MPGAAGLFLREAYLNGTYSPWRLPLLLTTGLLGMALGFFSVKVFWDKSAGVYDIFAKGINRKANKKLCAVVEEQIRSTDRVLECACGTGLLSSVIAKQCRELVATDFSANMLDWFTILSFYEASNHWLDGEALLEVKQSALKKLQFLGSLVNGNTSRWPYRLFEKTYVKYNKMQQEHQKKGEWMDSWKVEINPDHRTEGFSFHLVGCPIARHARDQSPVLEQYKDLEKI